MTSRVGDFILRETLGTGAFGKVRRAVHQASGRQYAIKIMEKVLIQTQEVTLNVRREIAIMKAFNHPNIVSVHNVLSSKTKLYVVLDLVQGPELFEVIAKRGTGGLPEKEARKYFHNLIDGVDYCHRRGVCHRDLKPENLLVDHDGTLKITDFGLSSMKGANTTTDLLTTQCGTPNYIAPEIISCLNPVYDGQKVDAWACGIILFALLAGYLPFDETDLAHLFEVIQKGHVHFPHWFSASARDLIWRLLCVDPDARASVQEVKQHPWFMVDYQSPSRSGVTSANARRRRRRSRASKSLDEVGTEKLSPRPTARQRPKRDLLALGRFNIPQPPALSMELPPLQLPLFERPLEPIEGNLSTARTAAAAAAETARVEMLRSRRTMSFSKKYSLLRKGIVNYSGLEIGVGSFLGPSTLGGEHQARMRGVLSTCNSSVSVSRCSVDGTTGPSSSEAEESYELRKATDDAIEQEATMQAIRSLRNAISSHRTVLGENGETASHSIEEEGHIRASTLNALRKLRDELQTSESHHCETSNIQISQGSSQCTSIMSPSQRKDTIRLLDVWETRILNDFQTGKGSDDTRVTEQEIFAFQSLLQTWETHLSGEDLVEDVLIPGSEIVDDESPAANVPERFVDTCKFLQHIECRRKACQREHSRTHGKNCDRWSSCSNSLSPVEDEEFPITSERPCLAEENAATAHYVSQKCGDLTKLWNHVLVANTSRLDSPTESSGPKNRTPITPEESREERTSSPITDSCPSPPLPDNEQLTLKGNEKDMKKSMVLSGTSNAITPNGMESYFLPPSSPDGRSRLQPLLRPQRASEDEQLLKSIKSHDILREPPLVRSHAQRQIQIESLSSQHEMEPLSSGDLAIANQAEKDRRSGSLRSKIEQLKSGDLHSQHIDSLVTSARRYNFLHLRSKYSAQFESGYDPRICMRELGRLMEEQGLEVSRKFGSKTLRVRIPGPQDHQELAASFDFHAKGQKGSVVYFKRTAGDRSVSRSAEETILSAFLRKLLDQFADSYPGFAVLVDST